MEVKINRNSAIWREHLVNIFTDILLSIFVHTISHAVLQYAFIITQSTQMYII